MEIKIGSLKSKLITDNPQLLELLHKKYSYKVPGYQYTPQYKRKVWDGSKSYFKQNGEFRTGILHRLIKDLQDIGVSSIDGYSSELIKEIEMQTIPVCSYFDYQESIIKESLLKKRVIIESPVGSGKTLIMAGIIKSLAPRKMIVMFKEKGILKQTYDFFKYCGLDNIGINSGEGYIYGDVMLTTVQSIEKVIDTHLEQSEVLMIDEAHQFCKGETTIAAIEAFPNAKWRIALTATVPSEKLDIHGRLTLEGAFGEVCSTKSIDDLIKDDKLTKPIIQILKYEPTLTPQDDDGSYQELYDKFVVNSIERNRMIQKIVESIYSNNKHAKVLILCKNLSHVQILKDLIPGSLTIEGKDSLESRYGIIKEFINSNEPSTIIGTNVMQTGININEITHMVNARGLEGEIPTIQGLGRGLRKAKNKKEMYFFDFYDCVPYLEKHSKKRISHYKKLKFEINYARL